MERTHDETQPRFRVDLVDQQGRIVSSQRIGDEREAVRSFASLAKADFGKELGRGSYVALVDDKQRLDAAKTHDGNGVYSTRFLREESRLAYEAVQPSPPGVRYPVDLVDSPSRTAPERAHRQAPAPESTSSSDRAQLDGSATPKAPAIPTPARNEIAAHGTAQERAEGGNEVPPGTRRSHPPLEDRFNVVKASGSRTYQFRDQPGKVAFTERWLSMTTASAHAAVVKAMVDRAEERSWSAVRLSGSEEFKRQAWIAAEARGIKAVGYEPTQSDRAASRQKELRLVRERPAGAAQPEVATGGTITRHGERAPRAEPPRPEEGSGGERSGALPARDAATTRRFASVMSELERAMDLKSVPEAQRANARIGVQRELDALARHDKMAKVKLYDLAASQQATAAGFQQQPQKAAPDRVR